MTELFDWVLRMSAAAGMTGLGVLGVRVLLRNRLPRWLFYLLWAVVLARAALPVSFTSSFSVFNLLPAFRRFPPEGLLPRFLTAVWLAGFVLLTAYSFFSYFITLFRLRTASRVDSEQTGLPEGVPVYRCNLYRTPVVCGLFRPKVLLPYGMDLAPSPELRHVMSHELTHVLRRDNLWKAAATLLLYLHWFNPVLWICYHRYLADMESSCDERVVSNASRDIRSEYASSLLRLASGGRGAVAGGLLAFGECALKERVRSIMRTRPPKAAVSLLCASLMAVFCLAFLTDPVPSAIIAEPQPPAAAAPAEDPPEAGTSAIPFDEVLRRNRELAAAGAVTPQPETSESRPEAAAQPQAQAESNAAQDLEPVIRAENPPELAVLISEVDYINYYPLARPRQSVGITGPDAVSRIVRLLNQTDGTELMPIAEGETDRLEIRLRNGSKYEYRSFSDTLEIGGIYYACPEELRGALEEYSGQLPAQAELLGYMNRYRIVEIWYQGGIFGGERRSYSASASETDRQTILEAAQQLKMLSATLVSEAAPAEPPPDESTVRLTLVFDSGVHYSISLGEDYMTLSASNETGNLLYQLNNLQEINKLYTILEEHQLIL